MFHKRLLKELKEHNKLLVGIVLAQWFALCLQVVMTYAIAAYMYDIYTGEVTYQKSARLVVILLVTMLGKSLFGTLQQKFSFQASSAVKKKLRDLVYQKLMLIGVGYTRVIPTAEAVQISTEGVEQLEIYFAKYVPQFFYSLLAPLTLFVITAQMSLQVAITLLLCVPLIPISIIAVQKFAKKLLQKYWGSYTGLGDSFLENIKGLTTMKIFGADARYEKKMNEEAEAFRKITMRVLIMQLNSISMMDLVAYGGAATGILLSVLALQRQDITFVQCFFLIMISAEFFLPLRLLGSYFHIAMNGNAAANKIFALLDTDHETVENAIKIKKDATAPAFDCQHVSFGYEKELVLKDISFQVPARSFTAIVGLSGSGKSTIASFLMGWQKKYQGTINIEGIDGKQLSSDSRYRSITYVGHNSYLLKGSVRETLQMGNPMATEQEMMHALEQVDMLSTVMEKGGLAMQIEEGGNNLSGGQKQRLALARAILHNSECYIFDEATSNVDVESEDRILHVIEELAKTKTIVMISHRLANVVHANQILFLEGGSIMEQGSHEMLMSKEKGSYKDLFLKQQSLEQFREESA